MCLKEFLQYDTRLRKILQDFWRNGIFTQCCQCKTESMILRNDMYVPNLCKNHTGGT